MILFITLSLTLLLAAGLDFMQLHLVKEKDIDASGMPSLNHMDFSDSNKAVSVASSLWDGHAVVT